ncbi:Uncharacterised protein [Mycobacteroides abscessus subsp. massiliense]|nr:Uncharacterised protein [Mycobacteroides abscessus subsp. massiliense]
MALDRHGDRPLAGPHLGGGLRGRAGRPAGSARLSDQLRRQTVCAPGYSRQCGLCGSAAALPRVAHDARCHGSRSRPRYAQSRGLRGSAQTGQGPLRRTGNFHGAEHYSAGRQSDRADVDTVPDQSAERRHVADSAVRKRTRGRHVEAGRGHNQDDQPDAAHL